MSGTFSKVKGSGLQNKFGSSLITTNKFGKSKLFGGCGKRWTGVIFALAILAICGVAIYFLSKHCGRPRLVCECRPISGRGHKFSYGGKRPGNSKGEHFEENKEGFVRSLHDIYAAAGREMPLTVEEKSVDLKLPPRKDAIEIGQSKETFDEPQYADDDDAPQYEVKKVSEVGGKWTSDKTEGERARGKMVGSSPFSASEMKQRKVVPDDEVDIYEPVKGISTGNPRLNNKTLGAIMIDDRGEGVNLGVSKPIETFGPAISTNSRLAGSSMNIAPITGACFKKYNTGSFFDNNSPEPPKLNILSGEPIPLKYNVNNTM